VNIDFFGTPTLVGLVVKLDRPMDREHPCCRNICVIRCRTRAAGWRTGLHRLRPASRLVVQSNRAMDRVGGEALRPADHADRRAQDAHVRVIPTSQTKEIFHHG
jgi:hypothetical protein